MDRILKTGTQGPDVRALQDALNFHIRRLPPLQLNGSFDRLTDQRLREFQRVNGLIPHGVLDGNTSAQLCEVTTVNLALGFQRKDAGAPGFQLPPLPPFTLPPLDGVKPPAGPAVPSVGQQFFLPPGALTRIPGLNGQMHVLNLKLDVPARKDPADPAVQSRKEIVEFVDRLPLDAPFRAWLISKVPDPSKSAKPPTPGFKWGIDPIVPHSFPVDKAGVNGNAQFSIIVTGGNGPGPKVMLAAWGDLKVVLDHINQEGQAHVRAQVTGSILGGFKGSF